MGYDVVFSTITSYYVSIIRIFSCNYMVTQAYIFFLDCTIRKSSYNFFLANVLSSFLTEAVGTCNKRAIMKRYPNNYFCTINFTQVERREELLAEEMMYRHKYNMTTEDFETLRWNVERTVPYYAGIQWKFSGSFYFALTVVTVIGMLIKYR